MNILLINNNVFIDKGDGGLYIYKATGLFAVELTALGNNVEMLQTTIKERSELHTFNVKETNIKITALPRYKYKIITYINCYLKGIKHILKNDFIYIYYPSNFKYFALIAKLLGKKYGLNVRGCIGLENTISKLLYKYAEVVFTVSPEFTDIVNQAGGKGYTQKSAISYDCNDIIRNRQYTTKDFYNILFLGRIDRDKGLFELLDSIKIMRSEGRKNFILTIVGDGQDIEALQKYSKNLDIEKYVVFYGAVSDNDEIRKLYTSADIYVLPTYHEGFPRTIYEALIFGTPVVVTFVGGIPAVMRDGENCYRIEHHSAISIALRLSYLMDNYSSVTSVVKNGSNLVENLFNPSRPTHAKHLNMILTCNEE